MHKIRPCFVVDEKIKYQLTYYNNKEELTGNERQIGPKGGGYYRGYYYGGNLRKEDMKIK